MGWDGMGRGEADRRVAAQHRLGRGRGRGRAGLPSSWAAAHGTAVAARRPSSMTRELGVAHTAREQGRACGMGRGALALAVARASVRPPCASPSTHAVPPPPAPPAHPPRHTRPLWGRASRRRRRSATAKRWGRPARSCRQGRPPEAPGTRQRRRRPKRRSRQAATGAGIGTPQQPSVSSRTPPLPTRPPPHTQTHALHPLCLWLTTCRAFPGRPLKQQTLLPDP